ncbi:ROK family protein [Streptomyces sp. DSM 44917]|uniref:ROK family protein n=1 Tax=Streptomyces boetiae TaxID=3075541 RepID=A0ABU2L1N8_9ACTN|nr:ROK family protein [Streptomyces sp. DSM 44917]MDT0305479.1 ROK family protein [Streptomyces sp. DSM 44917]
MSGQEPQESAHVLALDVGGTVLKGALIGADRRPLHQARRATPPADGPGGPGALVDAALEFAAELGALGAERLGRAPAAAGIVVPGVVDEREGIAVWSANLGLRDVPLRRLAAERLGGIPVRVGHDVRAGGLAEGRLGAGAGLERFLFVALGTGIAGAIGIEGRAEPGANGAAGEIGHVIVRPGGARCGCGQAGCLETVASAAAVGRAWAAVSGTPGATAADAVAAVQAGDARAAALWREAVEGLADGLLTAVRLLDPAAIVLGGGLAGAGETLLAPLRAALAAKVTFQRMPRLLPAALGDGAGCLGAALLAWDLLAPPAPRPRLAEATP